MRTLVLGDSLAALIDYRGKTPKKLGADFTRSGVPVASAQLVSDGVLHLEEARTVDLDTYRKWMSTPVAKGDVLLTSEAPLGRVARVASDGPLVLGQRLFGLRGLPGVLDSRYLYYALQTEAVQSELRGRATGSTVTGIRQSALRRVAIPAPEYHEQRAIAEVLGTLDDKIAANWQLVDTGDLLAAALTRQALDDARVPLGQIAVLTMGSSPPGTSYNEDGVGVVFYQGVRDFGVRFPTNRVWTTEPVRLAEPGDSLISVRAPVGRVNRASEPTCIGRGLAAARSLDGRPATLFHLLRHAPEVWEPYEAEGTVFGSINKAQLTTLLVPSVREPERATLEAGLAALELRITAALNESESLICMRDALLPQLMSGKIRVKDAENLVSEAV